MSNQSGTIRSVAWAEVFPWLMIPRALHLATSIPVLFVATVGVLLMPLGWWGAGFLLPEQNDSVADSVEAQIAEYWMTPRRLSVPSPAFSDSLELSDLYEPMVSTFAALVDPLRQMLRPALSWPELAYWAAGGIWNLLLWGLLGGIITRMAVMRYGRDEREGLVNAYRYVRHRLLAFVGTPLFALSGVIGAVLLCTPIGWLMHSDVGTLLASLVWLMVLIGGVTTTVFVVGLLLGWPLMWGALCAEEMGDVFEGAQRAYSYIFGRPLQYAFYAFVAAIVGSITYHVVHYFALLVVYFSYWAVAWTTGLEALEQGLTGGGGTSVGAVIIGGLNALVLVVATAFCYGFLFASAGTIYLLVRRDSDQIEFDMVHAPNQQVRYGLPPLTADEAGVPGVDDNGGQTR